MSVLCFPFSALLTKHYVTLSLIRSSQSWLRVCTTLSLQYSIFQCADVSTHARKKIRWDSSFFFLSLSLCTWCFSFWDISGFARFKSEEKQSWRDRHAKEIPATWGVLSQQNRGKESIVCVRALCKTHAENVIYFFSKQQLKLKEKYNSLSQGGFNRLSFRCDL